LLFEYDADGNRAAKRSTGAGVEILSPSGIYERMGEPGAIALGVHKFRIFANGQEVAQVLYDTSNESFTIQYLHRDHLNSVLYTTNAEGEPSEMRDFDAFGAAQSSPNWEGSMIESFGGYRNEPELGLLRAGARTYDPTFGVFTSPDPLLMSGLGSQGLNAYAYANNDPVNWFDPTGLAAEDPDDDEVTIHGERTPIVYPEGIPGAVMVNDEVTVFVYGCRPGGTGPFCVKEKREKRYETPFSSLHGAFGRREFSGVDTSATWERGLEIVLNVASMMVPVPGAPGVIKAVLQRSCGRAAQGWKWVAKVLGLTKDAATKGGTKLLTQGAYRAAGFAEGQLGKHFSKHAAEWGAGNITKAGYLKRAQSLLGKDVGGDILGAVRANGDVLRYNAATNEFAVGAANGTIRTLFRPSGGMSYWQSVTSGL
jgi:RHS repeat-associated protein